MTWCKLKIMSCKNWPWAWEWRLIQRLPIEDIRFINHSIINWSSSCAQSLSWMLTQLNKSHQNVKKQVQYMDCPRAAQPKCSKVSRTCKRMSLLKSMTPQSYEAPISKCWLLYNLILSAISKANSTRRRRGIPRWKKPIRQIKEVYRQHNLSPLNRAHVIVLTPSSLRSRRDPRRETSQIFLALWKAWWQNKTQELSLKSSSWKECKLACSENKDSNHK